MKNKISVKFGIYFKDRNEVITTATNVKHFKKEQLKKIKPYIFTVIKGLESDGVLQIKDLILKLDKFKVNNVYDFFLAKNKLKWNSNIKIQIKRNKKILDLILKIKTFENWKKKYPRVGIHVEKKEGNIKVSSIDMMSSALQEFLSDSSLKIDDQLTLVNYKTINRIEDFYIALGDMVPNKIINFKFWRNESLMEKDIKIINFNKFIKLNRKFCKQYWPKGVSDILVKEYENNDFYLDEKYKSRMLRAHYNKEHSLKISNIAVKAIQKGRFSLTKKGKLKKKKKKILFNP